MKNTIDTAVRTATSREECVGQNSQSPIPHDRQLDLSFVGGTCRRPAFGRSQILRARAQGWFDLMRRVVDNAVEWKPAPAGRPEQTALDLRRAA
jgi:hypothetical protein